MTIPHTFAPETGPLPLSWLDDNFTYVLANVTAGGSTTQVQFNSAGVFGGNAGFTYDATNYAVTIGKTSTASSYTGSLVQYGASFSELYLPGARTFPEVSSAALSVHRVSSQASGYSIGLQASVQNATVNPQSLVGIMSVVSNYGNGGSYAIGMFIAMELHGSQAAYGTAVDITDMNGNTPTYGHHVMLSRKSPGSYITIGFEAQANEYATNNDFTAAYVIDTVNYSTQAMWGIGFFADYAAVRNYAFASIGYAPRGTLTAGGISSLTVAGLPGASSIVYWGVTPDGLMLLDNLNHNPAIVAMTGSAPVWITVGAVGAPAFNSNWQSAAISGYTTPGYFRDALGIVHLKGLCTAGGSTPGSHVIFTLPTGYRPTKHMGFFNPGTGGITGYPSGISVLSTGDVYANDIDTAHNITWCLDSISFPTY